MRERRAGLVARRSGTSERIGCANDCRREENDRVIAADDRARGVEGAVSVERVVTARRERDDGREGMRLSRKRVRAP
jgi:hypothetical protein